MRWRARLAAVWRWRGELTGAFGDAGVLFPVAAALIKLNGLNPTAAFLVPGILYLAAGAWFRLPIPVQPLKATAAIALAQHAPPDLVAAGGFLMGLVLLALAATGLVGAVERLFPRPVVRGLQLGIGLVLMKEGWRMVSHPAWPGTAAGSGAATSGGPVAGVVGGLGGEMGGAAGPGWGPLWPDPGLPVPSLWLAALATLVLPQLPLTLGNACLATADAARHYFGERAARVTPRALLVSLGLANVAAGVCQGLPVCHGAGGLTAHVRFGARTRAATALTGAVCLALALGAGRGAPWVLERVPLPALGLFLLVVGVEHAALLADLRGRRQVLVALAVGGFGFVTGSLLAGVAAGWLAALAEEWRERAVRRTRRAAAAAQAVVSAGDGAAGERGAVPAGEEVGGGAYAC